MSTIKGIISYYILNKSPVYMCMLDASKAFDKVNLLFKKTVERDVPLMTTIYNKYVYWSKHSSKME